MSQGARRTSTKDFQNITNLGHISAKCHAYALTFEIRDPLALRCKYYRFSFAINCRSLRNVFAGNVNFS
jgi:hypothetical protein